MAVPSIQDVTKMRRQLFANKIVETANAGGLEAYDGLLTKLTEAGLSVEQIVGALAKLNFGELKNEFAHEQIEAVSERRQPAGNKKDSFRKDTFSKPAGRNKGGYADKPGVRGERFEKKSGKPYSSGRNGGMTTLTINIGKSEKISPSNIVGAIAGESGIPGSVLGQIDIFDRYTHVDVPATLVSEVLRGMTGAKIKGKKVRVVVMEGA
jgi:ATP-dependent RNA helicase DeaD